MLAEWHTEVLLPVFKEYYDSLCNVCENSSEIASRIRHGILQAFGRSLEIMWKRCIQGRVNDKQDFRVIFYEKDMIQDKAYLLDSV